MRTAQEKREAQRQATARWRANNPEKARASCQKSNATTGIAARARYRKRHPDAAAKASKKWRESHIEVAREKGRAYSLAYAATHREQERLRAAKWREDFPDKLRAMQRRHYLENKAMIAEARKEYRARNREKCREWANERKAKQRAGGGGLSRGYVVTLFKRQCGLCVACHADLQVTGKHIDHIVAISNGGLHCDENVQLLCPTCNRRKSAKDFDVFLRMMEAERG